MVNITTKGNAVVPALEKGLDAMECVHSSSVGMSLTEISASCGRSVSEMQRVVPYLAERGYFIRDDRGIYRASSKLFRLANRHHPFRELASVALPAMRDYATATGESVHLSIMESGKLLILADVPGTGHLRLSVSVGSQHDPQKSISGRVLLAFADKLNLAGAKRIVEAGYEFAPSHLLKGVKDLAVAVVLPDGEAIGVLATNWVDPVEGIAPLENHLLPELQKCAARISLSIEPSTLTKTT